MVRPDRMVLPQRALQASSSMLTYGLYHPKYWLQHTDHSAHRLQTHARKTSSARKMVPQPIRLSTGCLWLCTSKRHPTRPNTKSLPCTRAPSNAPHTSAYSASMAAAVAAAAVVPRWRRVGYLHVYLQ